jgi:ABC-type polysaccharide/polyol phosphate export permease
MTSYLADIWRFRYFWLSLVKMDLRVRYRRSLLGMGWSLLQPVAMTIILCAVFHTIFQATISEYAPFLLAGFATWGYITTVTTTGCQCFFNGESYIRQCPAPLAIYPLRMALGGTVHFLIAMVVVLGLSWYFHGFGNLGSLYSLVPTLVLLFFFVWAVAVLAGTANVHFQDTQHLTDVGFQMLFYATPVLYEADRLRVSGLGWLVDYNPVVPILQLIREPILECRVPSPTTFLAAGTTVFITVGLAAWTLARQQKRLIFYL